MPTSSARPENLDAFASGSRAADDELRNLADQLTPRYNEFLGDTSWGYFDIVSLLNAFGEYIGWNDVDARWVDQIAAAFRRAGGSGTIASLPDSAIEASLRAAGLDGDRGSVTFDDPVAFGFPPTTGYANDPVNTASGNFVELELDLPFTGLVEGLRFARTYNSRSEAAGAFGPGWSSWADARLHARPDGVHFTGPDGQQAVLPRMGAGYGRALGVNAVAAPLASGLALRWFGGEVWEFDEAGLPSRIRRGPGTEVRLTHDGDGRLTGLAHAGGKHVCLRWDGDRVTEVSCSDGRRASYDYDDLGNLVAATRCGAARRYEVDDRSRIVSVTDADGVVEVRNAYDDEGRVVEQRSPFGRRTFFSYLPGRVTVCSDDGGGPANTYVHDRAGRLLAILDGDEQRLGLNYDAWGNPVAVTERSGAVTVQEWDERARLVRRVSSTGAQLTFAYDDEDRVVEVTAGADAVTRYRYAGDERSPIEIVDPEGGVTRMTVEDGLVRRVVDPDGVELRFQFDADGNIVATTDGDGNCARLQRDVAGRVVTATTPLGRRTTFVYDDDGQPVERHDPASAVWRSEYTPAGRLAAVIDPTGARLQLRYGEHGSAVAAVDALGQMTERQHDAYGNVTGVVLPDGAQMHYGYDALMRLTTIGDPLGASWQREYDVNGNLTATIDPAGVRCSARFDEAGRVAELHDGLTWSSFEYDELDRTLAHVRPDGTQLRAEYDHCGRRVAIIDAAGGRTRLEYSPAGRVTKVVSASGRSERYEYDRCGRIAARIDGAGRRWEYGYDADGALAERVEPTGERARLSYDDAGRLAQTTAPGRGTVTYAYDAAGRTTQVSDRVSGTRSFEYDAAGRLVVAIDANGAATRYAHDALGRVTEIVDPLGNPTTRHYDQAGRLVAETDPLGRATTTSYDAAGRMTQRVDGSGRTGQWTYDSSGRIATFGAIGAPPTSVERDALGREIAIDEPGRFAHRLRWDENGRLVERRRGELALHWRYDADGRRAAIGHPDGSETTCAYDDGGFLVSKQHPGLGAISLERDAAGRLIGAGGDGMRGRWRYENGDLASYEIQTGELQRSMRLERDPIGRVVAAVADGASRRYSYDAGGRLLSAETPQGAFAFTYDAGGRLVREAADDRVVEYEHDVAGQLVARNATGEASVRYEYDGAGRRILAQHDGHERTYRYDGVGAIAAIGTADVRSQRMTQVAVDALGELAHVDRTPLLWDSADPLAPLAWRGDKAVVGHGTPWALAGGSETEWLTPDWQGTIGELPRDPWGAAMDGGSAAPQPGYRGELELEGLTWLRNRLYEPATRSFLAPDPLAPVSGTACAANPYHYAADNPIGLADPLGLRPVTDAELQEYRDGMNRNVWQQAGDFVVDNWEYIAAGAMVVGGVALMFTGVGGPAGVALMAASGGLIAAGGSAAIQRYTTGEVDWGRVAVDGAIGAVTAGAISGAVALAPRVMASSLFARGATTAAGGRLGSGAETFYRGMSNAELAGLTRTGQLSVRGESFVTQNLPYVEQLAARHPNLYQSIVRFEMQPGTQQALVSAGARSPGQLLVDEGLGHLPMISRGLPNVVHVKAELDAVNYGLRAGSAEIFNSRILGFAPL